MNRTPIEWAKNPDGSQGYTCNSKTGCFNGCPYCYARKKANGRLKSRYLANKNVAPKYGKDVLFRTYEVPTNIGSIDPFYPRFWPERLNQIRKRQKPAGIFLDDMADWMGDYWPEEWTEMELQTMRDCPQHRFYTLTKQPENLIKFSPFPSNCWVGVSATDDNMALQALLCLAQIRATRKFISFEPLQGHITFPTFIGYDGTHSILETLDWVIIGALTGTEKEIFDLYHFHGYSDLQPMQLNRSRLSLQPKIEWVNEICQAANKAGIAVFLKDNLKPLFDDCAKRSGVRYRLRQEWPK